MADQWTNRLSVYLDGELAEGERARLEAHLEDCAECRGAVQELRAVVSWAQSHEGRRPEVDAWPKISEGIRTGNRSGKVADLSAERVRRRRLRPILQALAAGIAVVTVASGGWLMGRRTSPPPTVVVVARSLDDGRSVATAIFAAERYGAAVADLERALTMEGIQLDTVTVRVLREKLTVIDRAIAEAREALANDPNSSYLADHFADMMRRKLALLRSAARAVTIQS